MQTTNGVLEGNKAYEKYLALKEQGLILFECIVGSQAYGTALPTSDIDKKFIYIDDLDSLLEGTKIDQINITDDYVGYELGRYFELLIKQSPNMHELIWSPQDCIEYCHPLFRLLIISERSKFLSKQIKYSFGEYANSQIKKARGLNKKIVNPIDETRKTVLDFCWIPYQQGRLNVVDWLSLYGLKQEHCGLTAIDNMHYTYHLFYDFASHAQNIKYFVNPKDDDDIDSTDFCFLASKHGHFWETLFPIEKFYKKIAKEERLQYKGIIQKETSNDVSVSAVGKDAKSLTTMYFNLEGYTRYCKDYKEYWEWVKKRNQVRYQTNLDHGAEYDSKNMAHCHRLLDTCIEALKSGIINVRRPNREQLLDIRNGYYTYEQLLSDANEKIQIIASLFETTSLPENIDIKLVKETILKFRKSFYSLK